MGSTLLARFSTRLFAEETLIMATLVEEEEEPREVEPVGEVVMAEQVSFFARRWKVFVAATFFLLGLLVALVTIFAGKESSDSPTHGPTPPPKYCSPCIDRSAYTIKALLHGDDAVGDYVVPSALQSAKDMGVNLEVEFYVGESSEEEERMADAIRLAAEKGSGTDALIVTVPSKKIANAVRYAADRGVPVFGMNAGFEFASGPGGLVEDGSMRFFTGMNDRLAGEMAADYFLREISGEYTRAIFVSDQLESFADSANEQRYQGYHDRLIEASNNSIDVGWIYNSSQAQAYANPIQGCLVRSVLVGSANLFFTVAGALQNHGCRGVKVGTFEPHLIPELNLVLTKGLDFVIDQFHHLQGWATVQSAALHVTTGITLAPPPGGAYSSGPVLLTENNITLKPKVRLCEDDASQIVDSPLDPECTERKNITIGGVVHGQQQNKFWDPVSSGADQGAIDLGVKLIFNRTELQENNETAYKQMAGQILRLCDSDIDGLFVSLPDDSIVDTVRLCQEMNPNLQIMSINAGYERSKELNLIHHIGMVEEDAGYQAGKEMERMATFSKALCCNHRPSLNVLNDRCKGFERAMIDLGIEYLGQVVVQEDNISQLKSSVESAVGESGAWDDYGMLLTDLAQLPAALELKKHHENFVMGSFDTSSLLHESLKTGDVLFGIEQQPYLQGYLPVSILAHAATTKQYFLDHLVKPGPRFVIAPPTVEEAACEAQNFPLCGAEGKSMITSSLPPRTTAPPTSSTQPSVSPTAHPSSSMQPSNLPSFDRRPTLEIVQSRGRIRCGLSRSAISSRVELCRAIAAVIVGNPDSFDRVTGPFSNRFRQLNDRSVDLLLRSDTHTIEREIRERTTRSGFTFSSPYYYDGMAYFGSKTLVECAEEQKRYDDCSSLKICTQQGSTVLDFVQSSFPPSFFVIGSSFNELVGMLWNNDCNVIAYDRSYLFDLPSMEENCDRQFIVGNKMMTKEPLAIVTRNNDREFSDVINWVVQALIYGEEQGLSKNSSLCQNHTNSTSYASELNFLNAVHCVGNYAEVFGGDHNSRGMNQINNGTTGMLYAIPFGDLDIPEDDLGSIDGMIGAGLNDLVEKRSLNCGVLIPDGFDGEVEGSNRIVEMSVEYCRTLAAALFQGNPDLANITRFSDEESSIVALNNGTIDVLAGGRAKRKYDFESSLLGPGVHFSSPYYYGNETARDDASFFSLATREDDAVFSSFVNCVVLGTIYAQENRINKENSKEMPLIQLFGSELRWALRDAIAYSGSYDEIYFGGVAGGSPLASLFHNFYQSRPLLSDRGRNTLNNIGGRQLLSLPGLSSRHKKKDE